MQLIEVEVISNVKSLPTEDNPDPKWPVEKIIIRVDAVEMIDPYVDYDRNTCKVLLNSKVPIEKGYRQNAGVGIAHIAINESMDSFARRVTLDKKYIALTD